MPADDTLDLEHNHDQGEPQMDPSTKELLQTQLMQSGNIGQNNFLTVQKALDYDHMENKRMVTLDEAVGVREVQSAANPGGPTPR